MAQCPSCMNHEPELVTKDENEFTCGACGTRFDKSGGVIVRDTPKPKVDARGRPISK